MEVHLGLPEGFILDLIREGDDWTFLLRLHALVEASLDHLVVAKLDRPVLHDWVVRHTIAGRTGKRALAALMQAIDADQAAMVDGLSDLRNQFAHGIRLMGVDLAVFIENAEQGERNKIARWVLKAHGYAPSSELDALALDALRKAPRLVLWVACRPLIERAYEVRRTARGRDIEGQFGITTESGVLLTTESGDVVVTGDAPDLDARRPQ